MNKHVESLLSRLERDVEDNKAEKDRLDQWLLVEREKSRLVDGVWTVTGEHEVLERRLNEARRRLAEAEARLSGARLMLSAWETP